jgi:hypothetical protein
MMCSFNLSPWDVRLIFGEISQPATIERPINVITLTGEVRMSPQLAKRVTTILDDQLRKYEQINGPIPQPPD